MAPSALSVLSLAEFKVEDSFLRCGACCCGVCLPLPPPRGPVGCHTTFGGAAGGCRELLLGFLACRFSGVSLAYAFQRW